MNRRAWLRAAVAVSVVCLMSVPMDARGRKKGATTDPGSYKEWGDEIDEIEIVQSFSLSEYNKVVVADFDTDKVELPEKSDNTYEPVKRVLKDPSSAFMTGLRDELEGLDVESGKKGERGTILIRGDVTTMDPGSRAARYWAGFGAGAARAQVELEAVDAATGKVLFRFVQERRSGVGVAGGGYEELMRRNLEAIGQDAAFILKQFK